MILFFFIFVIIWAILEAPSDRSTQYLKQSAQQRGDKTYFDAHGQERYTKTGERCCYIPCGAGQGIIKSYEDGHIIDVVGDVPPEVIAKHIYGWTRNPLTGRAH